MPQALRDTMGRHSTITLRQNRTTINHRCLLKFRCMIHNLGHMVIWRLPNTIKIHGGIGEINEIGFLLQGSHDETVNACFCYMYLHTVHLFLHVFMRLHI